MRKYIFSIVLALFAFCGSAYAQVNEIRTGAIARVITSSDFKGGFKNDFGVAGQISAGTKSWFFSGIYSFGNNALGTLDGILLPKRWDLYAVAVKNIKNNDGYLGIGTEKMFPLSEDVKVFIFGEIGTNFKFKKNTLSFGVILNTSRRILKRKT